MRSDVQVVPGPPLRWDILRGCSSVGRAIALQAIGHRFDPVHLHHFVISFKLKDKSFGFKSSNEEIYFNIVNKESTSID